MGGFVEAPRMMKKGHAIDVITTKEEERLFKEEEVEMGVGA